MDVKELAKLARIQMDDNEAQKLQGDVKRILDYIADIEKAPSVAAGEHSGQVRNVMRDDVVTHETGEYTERLLSNVPKRHGDYVEVQQILDK